MTGSKSMSQVQISNSRVNGAPPILITFGERLGIPNEEELAACTEISVTMQGPWHLPVKEKSPSCGLGGSLLSYRIPAAAWK